MEPDELDDLDEEGEGEAEDTQDTQAVTQHARARENRRGRTGNNAAVRQQLALDLRSTGHTFDEIAAKCGYSHRSVARRAVMAAAKYLAEDTAEEMRLNFKASYMPVRVALHRKARMGDVAAVFALVRLDEREARLFGLDLAAADPALSQHYMKRIVLEIESSAPVLALVPGDGHHNGHSTAIWGEGGYKATSPDSLHE